MSGKRHREVWEEAEEIRREEKGRATEATEAAAERMDANVRGAPTASGLAPDERLRIYDTIDRLLELLERK